jgi:hypothetical protein
MKNGFAPNGPVNGFSDQRLRAFIDDVVAPAYRERRATDRAEFFDRAYNDTMIGQGIQAMISGLTLPGDVAQGKFSMDDPRAIERVFDLASSVTLGAGAIPAPKNSLRAGIKAYHGSPHDFDKFSLDKIGTGEGAQAYGHGLYFADSEDVARSYRDALSTAREGPEYTAARILDLHGKDSDAALEYVSKRIDDAYAKGDADAARNSQAIKAALLDGRAAKAAPDGRMYEVEINANPDDFLDWDKPLSEQGEKVRTAFGNIVGRNLNDEPGWSKITGDRALNAVVERAGRVKRGGGEDLLKQAGIPGIKYLDGSSRAAGEGSRNYVVFDDKLINILRKYGIAVPAGMAGYEMTRDQFNTYVADQQAQQYERDNNMTRMGML